MHVEIDKNLSGYVPPREQQEFFKEYGIDYEEWFPFSQELSVESQEIYKWHNIETIQDDSRFITPIISPFTLFFINKRLKEYGLSAKDIYRSNSSGFRADEFSSEHDGLHILFSGCSITFGDGMFEEYMWARLTYDKIASETKVSGFYNIAFNGANHSDIILQTFKYIDRYGNPDVIFINFPDLKRQIESGMSIGPASVALYALYLGLELYCKTNNILLIAFSWEISDNVWKTGDAGKFIQVDFSDNKEGKDSRKLFGDPRNNFGKTYHRYMVQELHQHMMDYQAANKKHKYANIIMKGLDFIHPGMAEHDFYADFAYQIWRKENDKKN